MVSFPLRHLWCDVRTAIRMIGHPVIRIIRPKEYRQDSDDPQGGLVRGCRHLPVLVLVLTLFSVFFFQWKPISNINLSWDWLGRPEE